MMIQELRIYTVLPGQMPRLLTRFEGLTLRLFKRHGFRPSGFWTTAIGPGSNDLTYLLAWETLAEREAAWDAFVRDPEWIAGRAASEADGPIVANIASSILKPTALTAL